MPELPEVETVRRGLIPHLEGRVLAKVVARRPDLRQPLPENFAARLTGRRVQALERRAKYLIWRLDDGMALIVHLGMSGRILVDASPTASFHHDAPAAQAHDHVVFVTDHGHVVTYNDPRRFGLMTLCSTNQLHAHPLLAGLGPEPLGEDLSAAYLADAFMAKRAPIKAALLDQRLIAGLGNIYVVEALFLAAIAPQRLAGDLTKPEIKRLEAAIRKVLAAAIDAGGSSLRDFRQANGELGYFQHAFKVYDREGEPCPRRGCKGTIERSVQSNRSSFHCPNCQH